MAGSAVHALVKVDVGTHAMLLSFNLARCTEILGDGQDRNWVGSGVNIKHMPALTAKVWGWRSGLPLV